MLDYCYHTHTYRCGHGKGTEEEYVLKAIEQGYKVLGFAEHVFIPDVHMPGIRADIDELDDYLSTIRNLKEKYKDKITIYCGFEAEYSPFLINYYKSLLNEKKIDYLLLGQHFHFSSPTEFVTSFNQKEPRKALKLYTKEVIEGIKSGIFTYVAHPDIIVRVFKQPNRILPHYFKKICKVAAKYDIPLEINLNGSRISKLPQSSGLTHPYDEFYKIAKKYNCKFIIGIDAHDFRYLDHKESLEEKAFNLIGKYQLNHIGTNLSFISKK